MHIFKPWLISFQVCQPVFPLRIAVEAPFEVSTTRTLLHTTQIILDQMNEFSAHQLRLYPAESPLQNNASQQIITDDGSTRSDDKDVVLVVRLIRTETGTEPRSHLQAYSSTLDIYYPGNAAQAQATDPSLVGFIAQEVHALFAEERSQLTHVLANSPGGRSVQHALSSETSGDLRRGSTRALKYSPTYHLTFSLFTPSYTPSDWDIQPTLDAYIKPLLNSLSGVSSFTIDTQVQLYATIAPSVRQPQFDEEMKAWTLHKEDLSGFVNAAEWPLSPSIGEGPTVNFILYVPGSSQTPLLVKESGATSWLVPQWGGVHILNMHGESADNHVLAAEMLASPMHTFSDQLISLLGLPQSPASLPLRISTLERVRAASLVLSASSTLGALAQVYQKLPSIPVPDKVAQSVHQATLHLHEACASLKRGQFRSALEHARVAEVEAEKAFFERSMVGQVYFPDEHKVAVYLPLLGPVAVPLIMAGIKELKSALKRT